MKPLDLSSISNKYWISSLSYQIILNSIHNFCFSWEFIQQHLWVKSMENIEKNERYNLEKENLANETTFIIYFDA